MLLRQVAYAAMTLWSRATGLPVLAAAEIALRLVQVTVT
jgi:hypothetical protein